MSDSEPFRDLLAPDEPPAFEVIEGDDISPYFLICDHAGRRIPRALAELGLPELELQRHIAWDIGAAGVARRLAAELGAFLVLQTYSRLVIDCNRPLDAIDSIATESERTLVPGNQGLSPEQIEQRVQAVYRPYHDRIREELAARERAERETILVTVHSFTPIFLGVARVWQAGVLYHRDARFAHALLEVLRERTSYAVGDNQPYRVTDHSDVGVLEYGERRGNLHVELEIRQDLIAEAAGQAEWATRLAECLREAHARLRR
ncbi:MAG TPA: N-formylglutamate amidohydrolase [Polyangiaceae bacterium]|nr:N-formylglutamate amidohydrolase [Polyangiaceae bacterium]